MNELLIKRERLGVVEPVDPHSYKQVVRHSLSRVPDEAKEPMLRILHERNAVMFYNQLKEDGVPEDVIGTTLAYSAERLAEGKNPSIGAYLVAAGSKLMELDRKYGRVIEDAYEEGILNEHEYKTIRGRVGERQERMVKHARKHLSELETRVAAVWLLMAVGAVLMLLSGFTMTAAVVGSAFGVTSLFVLGLVLFVVGIILRAKKG